MLQIEAAIRFGVRPTAIILRQDSRKPWGKWDILIAEAYQMFKNEQCPQCGLPTWICHSDDPDIDFKIVDDTCFAMRRIRESESSGQTVDKKEKAQWGVSAHPSPYTFSKKPLGMEARDAFYKTKEDRRKALEPEGSL